METVTIGYDDFMALLDNLAKLKAIKAILETDNYASTLTIKRVLGIDVKKESPEDLQD